MKTSRLYWMLPMLAGALMIFAIGGCESDSTTEPGAGPSDVAPVLPSADRLSFDFSMFEGNFQQSKSQDFPKENFIQAATRVFFVKLMTDVLLTPPLAAFSLALHTPPSLQGDGSWIWVYTWVSGTEEVQIRLRGEPTGDGALWALRLTNLNAVPPIDQELWFDGETRDDGEFGDWTFYDFNLEGKPAVASLAWGTGLEGDFLTLTSLHGEDADDALTYRHDPPEASITFFDASAAQQWFIRWNESDGSGSLMVPDYNDGELACWDADQNNVRCDPILP